MAARTITQRPAPRPLGISLLALLQIWHGVLYLIVMLILVAVSSTASEEENEDKAGLAFLLALIYLVLGIYALWLARGYVKGFEWARRRGVSVAVFAIVLTFVGIFIVKLQVFAPESPFWTLVGNIIIIWYLRREKTRKFFASHLAVHGR